MFDVDKAEIIKYILTVFSFLFVTLMGLLTFIFKNMFLKKLDSVIDEVKNSEKISSIKIDNLDVSVGKKLEKMEEEIRRNKLDLDRKFEKYDADTDRRLEKIDIEFKMINKELIILQNDKKYIDKRLSKLEGYDSTQY